MCVSRFRFRCFFLIPKKTRKSKNASKAAATVSTGIFQTVFRPPHRFSIFSFCPHRLFRSPAFFSVFIKSTFPLASPLFKFNCRVGGRRFLPHGLAAIEVRWGQSTFVGRHRWAKKNPRENKETEARKESFSWIFAFSSSCCPFESSLSPSTTPRNGTRR